MVREVTAFQADDGTVFPNRLAALEHDALTKLKRFDIFNHASASAMLGHAQDIVAALEPLVEYKRSFPTAAESLVNEPTEESL